MRPSLKYGLAALCVAPAAAFGSVCATSFQRPVPMYTEASCIEIPVGLYQGRVHTYINQPDGGFRIEDGPFGGPLNYVLFVLGIW